MAKQRISKNMGGRPATGRNGEARSQYPHQVSARVHGDLFHLLAAVTTITGKANAIVIEEAIPAYLATLPADVRKAVESAAKAARQHCPTCNR
jgi:hypothetical protein